jgi:hypothetical protein
MVFGKLTAKAGHSSDLSGKPAEHLPAAHAKQRGKPSSFPVGKPAKDHRQKG